MNPNKIKGDQYEIQICKKIIKDGYVAYLWKDIPEEHLLKSKLASSQDELRLKRQNFKKDNQQENPYMDIGVDILQIDNNQKYIFVQCKNGYDSGLRIDDLAGFSYRMMQYNTTIGHVYYTSSLSSNIRDLQKDDRIKFLKIPFDENIELNKLRKPEECKIYVPPISEIINDGLELMCNFLMKCLLYNGNKKCVVYCQNDEIKKYKQQLIELNDNYYCTDFKICCIDDDKKYINPIDKLILISDTIVNFNQDSTFFTDKTKELVNDMMKNIKTNNESGNIYVWCNNYNCVNIFNSNLRTKIHVISTKLEDNAVKNNIELDEEILKQEIIKSITQELVQKKENETCNLRKWQNELIEDFLKFITSSDKSGVVISPTGAGKSFMMIYLSLLYMQMYEKDVIIVTQRKDILIGLDEEIKKYHDIFNKSALLKILPNEIEIIDNTNGDHKKEILNNTSNKRCLYIFNNSKFLTSLEFKDYKNLNHGKIGLICDDECHNSGADKMHDFLLYMINVKNIKLMGFSATPSRLHEVNKNNSLEVYGDKLQLNIIYERSYIDSLEDGDIVPVLWNIFKLSSDDVEEDIDDNDNEEKQDDETRGRTSKSFKKLSKNGRDKILKYISEAIVKSLFKKGIFYFETKTSLLEFYKYYMDNISKYDSLKYIKIHCTFCNADSKNLKQFNLEKENVDNAIANFKASNKNAILFAINRACEGFDDRKSDLGMRLYIANQTSPLLEYQRMGRFSRTYEEKENGVIKVQKLKSTYTSIELADTKELEDNYIARYAGWVSFINSFDSCKSKYTKRNDVVENKIVTIDKLFDVGEMTEIDIVKLKEKIRQEMVKINSTHDFNKIIKKLKNLNVFNIDCNFWIKYDEIKNKEYLGLPVTHGDLYEKFQKYFDDKTWYEILGYDTSIWYQSVKECKEELKKIHNGNITEHNYYELRKIDNKLPPHPIDYYKGLITIENLSCCDNKKKCV